MNNVLLAFTAEGVANSFALADHLGIDGNGSSTPLDGGPLVSQWESGKFQRIAKDDFSPEFPLGLALKDVDLALAEGDRDRFSVLAALSKEWTGIAEQGLGTEDITIVTKVLAG